MGAGGVVGCRAETSGCLAVPAGSTVTEVAASLRVARQTVSGWKSRYEASGLAGPADRSRRPADRGSSAWQGRRVGSNQVRTS